MEQNKKEEYIYWEGVVERVTKNKAKGTGNAIYSYDFKIGNDHGINRDEYKIAYGQGFGKKNLPEEGDTVLLRYKDGKGSLCSKEYSKIVKIIKKFDEV